MKALVLMLLATFTLSTFANAEEVYKITVPRDRTYSKRELRERVWDLERAVWQLQQRVFQLEADAANPMPTKPEEPDTWICTISAMGKPYVGTGPTKAVATAKATKSCQSAKDQDSFFCKDPKCEQ